MIDLLFVQNRLMDGSCKPSKLEVYPKSDFTRLKKITSLIFHSRMTPKGRTILANHNKKYEVNFSMLIDRVRSIESIKAEIRPLLMINVLPTNSFSIQNKARIDA